MLSEWDDGIQPWDFNLQTYGEDGPLMLHSVLDRSLLRAGETVSMKHYARQHSSAGVGLPSPMPTAMRIVHVGSDEARESPVSFDPAGIAESSWEIPADARLGTYRIDMREGDRWRESGSFRVEQFRLPTMRGLIQPPAEPLVNAREARLDLFVGYLNGGGAGGLPVKLRTLVRPRELSYPDYADFRFAADPVREGIEQSGAEEWRDDGEAQAPGLAQVHSARRSIRRARHASPCPTCGQVQGAAGAGGRARVPRRQRRAADRVEPRPAVAGAAEPRDQVGELGAGTRACPLRGRGARPVRPAA